MKVLVLGATGMLGSMVYNHLRRLSYMSVTGTARKGINNFIKYDIYNGLDNSALDGLEIDFIINCIGITKPYCHDDNRSEIKNAVYVNSLFPLTLAEFSEKRGIKVIQIATDCVFSGTKGPYSEDSPHDPLDVYGKTKSLGELKSKALLNVRCSIIGPEKYKKDFLLEWFLMQPEETKVNGFAHHLWNGVTTLQFARLCELIIIKNKFDTLVNESNTHHFIPNSAVNKYELLNIFNKVFDKKLIVERYEDKKNILDRTLVSKYNIISSFFPSVNMENALVELKQYIEEEGFYNA